MRRIVMAELFLEILQNISKRWFYYVISMGKD